MIVVHGFAPIPPLASPSPFCLKLEAWMRLAGIPYETAEFSPFQAPKGKAPYIQFDDGTLLGDSALIIDRLTRDHAVTLDHGMSPRQQAVATLLQRTIEDHLYFAILYFRWVRDEGFAVLRDAYFGRMPIPLRWMIPRMARRGVVAACHAQGTSRHSPEDVAAMAARDIAAIAEILADNPWMLGSEPHGIDAVVYGAVANLHLGPFDDPLRAAVRSHPNLVAYAERVHAHLWPDAG